MPAAWNKKVLLVGMQWDYCDKSRGVSSDKLMFFDSISKLVSGAEAFWYDDYIGDLPRLRELAYEKAAAYGPDLIFFPTYQDQFDAAALDRFGARWPTCAWFGDDTWRFEDYSSKLAPHFTHVCTTDPFSVEKYRASGIEPILTQWAARPYGTVSGPLPPGGKFRFDVSFVGGYNRVRAWFINRLARQGIKVECFGHGWPNGKVDFEEMGRIFRDTRINLNLSNSASRDPGFLLSSPLNIVRYLRSPKKAEQIKARNFEIPLAGGFQLTNAVPGLELYLKPGEEVALYTSPEECAGLIRRYLGSEADRRRIAAAGYARAAAEHTCEKRMEDIFRRIWQ